MDKKGRNGAPDLVVEILLHGNSRTEMKDKFEIYQQAGVLEYSIVSPTEKMIQIFSLNERGVYIGLQPKVEGNTIYTLIMEKNWLLK